MKDLRSITKDRKGQTGLATIAIIALVGLAAYLALTPGGQDTTTTKKVDTSQCQDSSTTVTVGPQSEWGDSTADVSNENAQVWVNGVDKGKIQDGNTFSAQVGADYKIAYAINSSTYYAAKHEGQVECGDFDTAQQDDGKHKLAKDASLTMNVFNEDDGDINSNSNKQPISSDEEVTLEVDFKSNTDEALSPYGDAIMVLEANTSEFGMTDFEVSPEASSDATVPSFVTSGSGNKTVAFRIPGGPNPTSSDENRYRFKGTITIKGDSSQDPSQNINVKIFGEDYFQRSDNGELDFDVEDDTGSRVGFAAEETTIHVS